VELSEFAPTQQVRLPRTPAAAASTVAIDAHAHLGRWLSGWVGVPGSWLVEQPAAFLDAMAVDNVHSFVNLDGRWGDELRENLERFDGAHPGRFATFCHIDWSALLERDATDALIRTVVDSAAVGAAGIRVWKDLGLSVRDRSESLVLPDDDRLEPLWTAVGDLGLPVWWHVADPAAFFEPVDARNENDETLRARPDWSCHGTEAPSFTRLLAAFEGVVAAHPRVDVVAVHGGCCAEDLAWVERMLAGYPNLSIDIAARTAQLGRQPRATTALIERFPTRSSSGPTRSRLVDASTRRTSGCSRRRTSPSRTAPRIRSSWVAGPSAASTSHPTSSSWCTARTSSAWPRLTGDRQQEEAR